MYTFVETKLFTRLIDDYLSDEEFAALQISLAVNPEAGDVIALMGSASYDGQAAIGASVVDFG